MGEDRDNNAPMALSELKEVLTSWRIGDLSSDELHNWMELNYMPLHRDIGDGEALHTQRAMNWVMNAFEHAAPSDMDPDGYEAAIAFLDTAEHQFSERESLFLRSCFRSMRTA